MGLDFALLESALLGSDPDVQILRPEGDDDLRVHSRLIHRAAPPECRRVFLERFSGAAIQRSTAHQEQASAMALSGNRSQALASFQIALERNPRNWLLIGEAAVFAREQLRDAPLAIELARKALDLNPWYSPWLWNLLGESFAGAGRHPEAHDCHLRAERIRPDDPATQCYLAGSWLRRGDPAQSLQAVARGLAADSAGMHRHVLLDRQQEAIGALALRWARERESSSRRQETPSPDL
ncbi:MAG TPA: hypothetical protein DEH78_03560 [Solibacterales bacterium]|nr:hypothetical protein [Bryobacterales bacterium]